MKKILLLALAAVLVFACGSSLPAKMTKLADQVSAKGTDMTPAQWEKANAQFEKMVKEYTDNYDSFTTDQKKEINVAIGKYTAAAIKSGLNDAAKEIDGLLKKIPDSVDAALEGVNEFLKELGL